MVSLFYSVLQVLACRWLLVRLAIPRCGGGAVCWEPSRTKPVFFALVLGGCVGLWALREVCLSSAEAPLLFCGRMAMATWIDNCLSLSAPDGVRWGPTLFLFAFVLPYVRWESSSGRGGQ